MDDDEKIEYLIQNCFIELEELSGDFISHILLNYALVESDEEKLVFINKSISELKNQIGSLKGDIAESLFEIITSRIKLEDFPHFYSMLHSKFESQLRFYISLNIDFYSNDLNPNEKYVVGNIAQQYKSLKNWIDAMVKAINLITLEHYKRRLEKVSMPELKEDFYSSKKVSKFIRFNDGRVLNHLERFKLLDGFIGIESAIRKLKIHNEEKELLLAHILSCNPKNAQQILNGTYDGKLREKEISQYLDKLKKE